MNTGAPQGCVLSPILFSFLTSDFVSSPTSSCRVVKYADDTCIIGLVKNNDEAEYRNTVSNFVSWSDRASLVLNTQKKKTKEMIFDFRKTSRSEQAPLYIDNEPIEQVSEYKYLGTIIDDKINWDANTRRIQSKGNQRLYS